LKKQSRSQPREVVFLCVSVVLFATLLSSPALSQTWPSCVDPSCSAGDLTIARVYVDAGDCSGSSRTGTIKVDITPTGGTRYRVRVRASLFLVESLNGGEIETPHPTIPVLDVCEEEIAATTTLTLHNALPPYETSITWDCDKSLRIKDVLVAWEVNSGAPDCTTTYDCSQIGSKCDYTATVTVEGSEPPNAPPAAADGAVTVDEDSSYPFAIGDFNYTDAEGDSLSKVQITALETVGDLTLGGIDVTLNQEISAAAISAGNLVFSPQPDENGINYDNFGFKVHDGTEYSTSSYTMTLHITPVNDPPTAASGVVATGEDTPHVFSLIDFGYADIEGDPIAKVVVTVLETIGDLTLGGIDVTLNQEISAAAISAGNLVFSPQPDENGTNYDSFGFKVHDGTEYSTSSYTMTLHVTPVNDPPTAADDSASTQENTPVLIDVTANDTDPDGDLLQIVTVAGAEHGITLIVGNEIRYSPATFFYGADRIEYTIEDAGGVQASAEVGVQVIHPNEPPRAEADGVYLGTVGDPILFDARFSTDPDIQDVLQYRWDVNNDRQWEADWLPVATFQFVYERPYRGPVTVEVRDLYRGVPNGTTSRASSFAIVEPRPTQIAVSVYVDLNVNGEFDEEDVGLPGVTLLLDETLEIVTAEDGTAFVEDVEPGIHTVRISEAGVSYLSDRGFFLVEEALESIELESGEWVALFFSPEARGFLEVDVGAEAEDERQSQDGG
jgi:hypothetical protein